MSKLEELYKRAVAKLGADNIGAMANVTGAIDGTLDTVPQSRRAEFEAVLNRILGSSAAIARAQADFKAIDEARAKARREPKPNTPNVIDNQFVADVYAKWNTKRESAE